MKKNFFLVMLLPTMLMQGCQQSSRSYAEETPVQKQLAQLSAILASSEYLRNQCNRNDIPDKKDLTQKALNMAKDRGWDSGAQAYKNLNALTEQRYQHLLNDETPKKEKCSLLSQVVAPFVARDTAVQAHKASDKEL
jgi:general secretion pathway protein S